MEWYDIYNKLAERRNTVRLNRENIVNRKTATINEVKFYMRDEEKFLDSLMDEIDDAHGREHE